MDFSSNGPDGGGTADENARLTIKLKETCDDVESWRKAAIGKADENARLREENRRLALAVADMTRRIAELERENTMLRERD